MIWTEAFKKFNWKRIALLFGMMISLLFIGKLSASYEGCLILYSPRRWLISLLLIIPLWFFWLLRDTFIKSEEKG